MLLNIDLHTHTRRYSRCSVLSPDQLCETAVARGLDALVITEHHYQWADDEIAVLQTRHPAIKLYAGVEISCDDGRDYVVLGLSPGPYGPAHMPVERFQSLLETRPGTFAFIAHCFRHSADERGLANLRVDGIEVASYNILSRPQPLAGPAEIVRAELYHKWQKKMDWVPLCNSDGHSERMIGTFFSQIESCDGFPRDEVALGVCCAAPRCAACRTTN